jgi:hypothetical protein
VELVAGGELVAFGGEVADAVGAGAFVEGAVLERGQVAVDGLLGGLDLAGDAVEFCGVLVGGLVPEGGRSGDGLVMRSVRA